MATRLEQFIAVSTILDAADVVLYVADMQTHEVLFFNGHAEELWGSQWAGRRCYDVLQKGQTGPCAFCTNHRLLEADGRAASPVEWEFQNTVNKRWYLCIDKAIPWTDGRLVRMEVAIDITEMKAHERFRDEYVQLISHDLRSPLATIMLGASGLERLLEKHGLTEAGKSLDAILRSSRRMTDMIDDLLETTRLESGQLQLHKCPVDLNALAAAVGGRLGTQASRPVRFERTRPAQVLADAARIERVLENLVGNALRYSAPGTAVTLHVDANDTEAVLSVADRGPGIPADELPKLFQRFYRGSPGRSAMDGLGLGLYSSRLIVESHGGRIWAQSEAGTGSTFFLALPVAAPGDRSGTQAR